jgi:hypothetical protein
MPLVSLENKKAWCINGCSELLKVIPFYRAGAYEPKKAGIAHAHKSSFLVSTT